MDGRFYLSIDIVPFQSKCPLLWVKLFLNCIDLFTYKYTLYTMDGQVLQPVFDIVPFQKFVHYKIIPIYVLNKYTLFYDELDEGKSWLWHKVFRHCYIQNCPLYEVKSSLWTERIYVVLCTPIYIVQV